ncbi:MAG: prolipoprotein diacylglyceryl transferase [Acholeplasmatales bacterium]|nr:prolipoprotein diacylglyceryl transferase [Acholeplasmatales bacterium]
MHVINDLDAFLPQGIEIAGIQIRFYALCILFGMIIAIILGIRECKKMEISTDDIFNGAVIGIILGILGARIYYVIFEWDTYKNNFAEVFAIWNGGLAIHGGIIVAFVFAFFYCRKKKINVLAVLDFVAIGLLVGQICGRWGNFFNQEAHGGETTLAFLHSLPIPEFIVKQMEIDGVYYHPTFLYESIWNLVCLFAVLVLRRTKTIRLGDIAGIYLIWYGIGRFWIEGMRTDSLMIGSIKQNQLISIVLIVLGIAYLIFKYVKLKPMYYIYYLVPEFEPVINKKMNERLIARDERIALEEAMLNMDSPNEKNEEVKKEEPIEQYEVPEELKTDAPFRKSKYIVDDYEADDDKK